MRTANVYGCPGLVFLDPGGPYDLGHRLVIHPASWIGTMFTNTAAVVDQVRAPEAGGLTVGGAGSADPSGVNWSYDRGATPTVNADERRPPDSGPDAPSNLSPLDLLSTRQLLDHVRNGNLEAREVLFSRCVPALRRWARGRLPSGARGMLQTEDIVQEAVFSVLKHLDTFEARHQGALQGYLRETALNRIRDVGRQIANRPVAIELQDEHAAAGRSPLEQAIDHDALEQYEAALARLSPVYREAVIARLEM
jgi:RNA polymerase sigma factor (sigma-70 family)